MCLTRFPILNLSVALCPTLLCLLLLCLPGGIVSAEEVRESLRREVQPPAAISEQQLMMRPGYGFENEVTAPGWDWDLPFSPVAGQADSQRIYFANLNENTLEVYSSNLHMQRLRARQVVYPEWSMTARHETPYDDPRVFAAKGGWIVTQGGEGMWYSSEQGAPPSPVLFAELAIDDIEHLIVAEDRFFIQTTTTGTLGENVRAIFHAPYSLSGRIETWERLPRPPGNLEDYGWMVSNGRVIVAGGTELDMEQTDLVRSYPLANSDGRWRELMYRLPATPGPTRGIAMNSLAIALPSNPTLDARGEWPLQRVYWAHDRADGGGTVDQWLSYTYDFPAPRDPIIFPIDGAQVLVFAGGIDGPTGEPNRVAYLRAARTTNEYRLLANPPRFPTRNPLGAALEPRNRIVFAHYQTGLRRAKQQGKHHVVLLLDEHTYNDEEARLDLLRDTNVIPMLQEFIVSTPWPDDLPKVRELMGTSEAPAVALLSPDGELLGTHQGIPNRQEMFQLLLPAWGTTAVAAPGYVPPMN